MLNTPKRDFSSVQSWINLGFCLNIAVNHIYIYIFVYLGQVELVAVQHQTVGGRRRLGEPPAVQILRSVGGLVRVRIAGRVQVVRPVAGLDELIVFAGTAVRPVVVVEHDAVRCGRGDGVHGIRTRRPRDDDDRERSQGTGREPRYRRRHNFRVVRAVRDGVYWFSLTIRRNKKQKIPGAYWKRECK